MFNGRFFPRTTIAPAALIALAGVLAYANTWHAPFVFDDYPAIVENRSIRSLASMGEVLRPADAGISGTTGRPLLNLTFALNYALGGLNVTGYHVFNLIIHILAGLTLFGIVRRMWRLVGRPTAMGPL